MPLQNYHFHTYRLFIFWTVFHPHAYIFWTWIKVRLQKIKSLGKTFLKKPVWILSFSSVFPYFLSPSFSQRISMADSKLKILTMKTLNVQFQSLLLMSQGWIHFFYLLILPSFPCILQPCLTVIPVGENTKMDSSVISG